MKREIVAPITIHGTDLPGPNPGLPLSMTWSVTSYNDGIDFHLRVHDPFGTLIHEHKWTQSITMEG